LLVRGRWLKPEFVKDKKMGQLGLAAAIVYQTLWCMADDGGVAKGAAEEIKGEMLVWWHELDVDGVRSSLAKLEESGRITGYTVGDDQYWTLHNLLKHQGKIHKPSKFRHPRPKQCRSSVEPVPESVGTAPYLDTSIPQHLDSSIPSAESAGDDAKELWGAARTLITSLNQGMQDNPAIGEALNPVPHGHALSLTAVEEITRAGVPPEFAASVIYEGAKKYKPAGRNRQIKSLAYLTASVIDAWEKQNALTAATSTSRPAVAPRGEHRSVRGQTLAASRLIEKVRKLRNPQFPRSLIAGWRDHLTHEEAEAVYPFVERILSDDPKGEGTLTAHLTKALEESEQSTGAAA
jgi:hypothetical protein